MYDSNSNYKRYARTKSQGQRVSKILLSTELIVLSGKKSGFLFSERERERVGEIKDEGWNKKFHEDKEDNLRSSV